jgi:hypothetical protein
MKQGDIITAFAGVEPGLRGLSRMLGPDSVGQERAVTIVRAGGGLELRLSIGERPAA